MSESVEHFEAGTNVYVDGWGATVFVVQGLVPWREDDGTWSERIEVKTGGLTGHVNPKQLQRVRPS